MGTPLPTCICVLPTSLPVYDPTKGHTTWATTAIKTRCPSYKWVLMVRTGHLGKKNSTRHRWPGAAHPPSAPPRQGIRKRKRPRQSPASDQKGTCNPDSCCINTRRTDVGNRHPKGLYFNLNPTRGLLILPACDLERPFDSRLIRQVLKELEPGLSAFLGTSSLETDMGFWSIGLFGNTIGHGTWRCYPMLWVIQLLV